MSEPIVAPDGSIVVPLARLGEALSTATFTLAPGLVSRAVVHATVGEIWHVLEGEGRLWTRHRDSAEEHELAAGVTVGIEVGTVFQFRSEGDGRLVIYGVTSPAWPLDPDRAAAEATVVEGRWPPRL
jgi:mannose-6-phosphate isomerase-like protein (cupin superfamily)